VSDAGGNVEVVTHGQNGWVVPKGDEAAMAKTLIEVLRDPAEAERRANKATESLDRFSWPLLVDEYDAAIKSLEPQRREGHKEA
jgi:glycosyltransferase involved in cell wall biosynthesis